MKRIKLFESFANNDKVEKANNIFGPWLMFKLFSRSKFRKKVSDTDLYDEEIFYLKPNGDKVIRIVKDDGSYVIRVAREWTSKNVREFLTRCGFKNPDGREYWRWYGVAVRKIYGLPDDALVKTLL
jgi:hypothetical protein